MQSINEWLPWVGVIVFAIASAISSYYMYAKKNDPSAAEKIKHVGELANWAVAYQKKFTDKSGTDKFQDAVTSVLMQTPYRINKDTVKGAVEHAYLNMENNGGNKDA